MESSTPSSGESSARHPPVNQQYKLVLINPPGLMLFSAPVPNLVQALVGSTGCIFLATLPRGLSDTQRERFGSTLSWTLWRFTDWIILQPFRMVFDTMTAKRQD